MAKIKKPLKIICIACALIVFAMITMLLMLEYYEWTAYGKVKNFREVQECIETGKVNGSEAHCQEIIEQRKLNIDKAK